MATEKVFCNRCGKKFRTKYKVITRSYVLNVGEIKYVRGLYLIAHCKTCFNHRDATIELRKAPDITALIDKMKRQHGYK